MRISTAALTIPLAALLAMACNEKPAKAAPAAKSTTVKSSAAIPAGAANAAVPTAAPAGKKKRGGKQYAVVARPVTIKSGGKTVHKLTIQPIKGLKFNKDFPSKFVVSPGKHAVCDKKKLSSRGGDVKTEGKMGVVSIPLSAKAAGTEKLSIMASFSVCNDEQCFLLRGEMLNLPVTVR